MATVLFGLSHFSGVEAETTRYKLEPDMIASGVFVFWGKQESFSRENGANIVNTGFIVGRDAILAIDTGPTSTVRRGDDRGHKGCLAPSHSSRSCHPSPRRSRFWHTNF